MDGFLGFAVIGGLIVAYIGVITTFGFTWPGAWQLDRPHGPRERLGIRLLFGGWLVAGAASVALTGYGPASP